jgi:serine/threonine protein kinase
VELLAEEFVARKRRGEKPNLSEYTEKYPEFAAEIRDLFPALVMMEDVADSSLASTGPHIGGTVALKQVGDYRILREVGRGGMGVVYEAEQQSLGRRVALKVLPPHALNETQQLRRFEREARAAARLHHTNIVPVFGEGREGGLHYYVMQFISGLGLDEVLVELKQLRKGAREETPTDNRTKAGRPGEVSALSIAQGLLTGQVPESPAPNASRGDGWPLGTPRSREGGGPDASSAIHLPGLADGSTLSGSGRAYWQSVARIGIQVAEAVAYATGQGILHRDIKPSNLLLDTKGNVWVTDFGLAKSSDGEDLTHTGDIVGTLRYMAPERFNGQADVRSDIYSLGLTLYQLLTLRPAFEEKDRNQLIRQVTYAEPPRPAQLNPDVPRDLETVVLKAMDRDPARRYQTPAQLAQDLRRFVAGEPIRARRISAWRRAVLWARRRPAAAALLLVSGLAALAPSSAPCTTRNCKRPSTTPRNSGRRQNGLSTSITLPGRTLVGGTAPWAEWRNCSMPARPTSATGSGIT